MLFSSKWLLVVVTVAFLAQGCCPEEQAVKTTPFQQTEQVAEQTEVPSGEGMWPWSHIGEMDEQALKDRGLEVPLSKLWTPGKGGLAGAAVGLGGCTGSFISDDGLLLTNHHCVLRAVQRNSTDEKNLLNDGYVASNRAQELDGYGIKVYVFNNQKDVTDRISSSLAKLKDPTDLERMKAIEAEEKKLVKTCEEKPNARCYVSKNNDGLSYTLFERLEIRDVRLVAAPPSSVGNYGGEIDNWHWPRHSMDFSLIRAYVDKEGKPADFNENNVPFKPEHFFKVSQKGVSTGDLVMIIGTPGRTNRYRTSTSLQNALEWHYPLRVSLMSEWIEILEETCKEIPDSCLPTSASIRGLSNGLTNSAGMIVGLNRIGLLDKKLEQETKWREWVTGSGERKATYETTLNELQQHLDKSKEGRTRDLLVQYMASSWRSHFIGYARSITKWAAEQKKPDIEREQGFQDRDRERVLSRLTKSQGSVHQEADKRVMAMFLKRLGELPQSEHVGALDNALKGDYSEASIARFLKSLYTGTKMGEKESRSALFEKSLADLEKSNDTMIKLALALAPEMDALNDRNKSFAGAMTRLRPAYVRSLIEMKKNTFYPDANGSPRISFATVTGYKPKDGVVHTPFTSLKGLAAKHTGEKPFDAPESILTATAESNWGSYGDEDLGSVPVCFLSNGDTTGGNSGSPAINGKGELVGLNFDRVYENIPGDWGYNPPLSRNIMVDTRSVLWYLDVILDATHLLKEMGVTGQPAH